MTDLRSIYFTMNRANGYVARREIKELLQDFNPNYDYRLEPYGFKVYSQNDEDGIIEEIFNRLGIGVGTFVEIGVGNGLECNTLYLLHKGWTGKWIDTSIISPKFNPLIESRKLTFIRTMVIIKNINDLIKEDEDIDFLSIDVDGMDIHLWKALKAKPNVVCIEYNAKFPPPLSKIQVYDPHFAWQGTDYFGASLTAINDVARDKGYVLVGTNFIGINAFFVRADFLKRERFSQRDVSSLYNPPRYWLTDAYNNIGHPPDFGPYEDMQ